MPWYVLSLQTNKLGIAFGTEEGLSALYFLFLVYAFDYFSFLVQNVL